LTDKYWKDFSDYW